MSEQKTNNAIFPLVMIGLLLRGFGVLNPIHEIMHMIMVESLGGFVVKLEWSRVWWTGVPEHLYPIVHGCAYWMELVLYSGIILVRQERAGIAYGILWGVMIRGLVSTDFARVDSAMNYVMFFIVAGSLIIWGGKVLSRGSERTEQKTKSFAQQIGA